MCWVRWRRQQNRGVEFELRSFGLFFSKLRSCDIPTAKKSMKTNAKDVTASPAFFTACEIIPSKRRNVKSKNTKARKKINFDQETDTQSQSQSLSLSQRFGNPRKPTYAEVVCVCVWYLLILDVNALASTFPCISAKTLCLSTSARIIVRDSRSLMYIYIYSIKFKFDQYNNAYFWNFKFWIWKYMFVI